jgi:hypothetical protein
MDNSMTGVPSKSKLVSFTNPICSRNEMKRVSASYARTQDDGGEKDKNEMGKKIGILHLALE